MNKLLSLLIILNFSTIHMNGAEQVLTSFETSGQKITDWQIVDDGVMGGLLSLIHISEPTRPY